MSTLPKLVVFTDADISSCSWIQTFRDSDGLWENHNVDQAANILAFKKNFEVVHRFYNAQRAQLAEVEPNAAHRMLARLQSYFGKRMTQITLNIDDLLERGWMRGRAPRSRPSHQHALPRLRPAVRNRATRPGTRRSTPARSSAVARSGA
ncbi:Sir2 family NAD-dependent protein deacetylase [Methylobacterium nodulans]|uniref:Sir2 family NAD-dependent protein deacetylase n=1 Tax=Methylobacterium nodulans TaxID=114616 RepID=UPI0009FBAB0C